MEGKEVSSGPWREEEEDEDESTAGSNPRTSGQPGGSVGAVAPISQDRHTGTGTENKDKAQSQTTAPARQHQHWARQRAAPH